MGINRNAAMETLLRSRNVVEAMVLYIEERGCNGFKCRECPLTLVCDHYPAHSKDYAHEVILKTRSVLSAGQRQKETSEAR